MLQWYFCGVFVVFFPEVVVKVVFFSIVSIYNFFYLFLRSEKIKNFHTYIY